MMLIDYDLDDSFDIQIQDGDFKLLSNTTEATSQRLEQKLLLFRGEWFLDVTAGVPWVAEVFNSRPRLEILSSLFRQIIENDPGVAALQDFNVGFQSVDRKLEIDFVVKLVSGDTTAGAVTL